VVRAALVGHYFRQVTPVGALPAPISLLPVIASATWALVTAGPTDHECGRGFPTLRPDGGDQAGYPPPTGP